MNPLGSGLVYSTYLGGTGDDGGSQIAVNANGHAYIVGGTDSTDFPTTAGAFQTTSGGNTDVVVVKVNPAGSGLVYSTYLGGSGDESDMCMALDANGSVYVTGQTPSPNFPTTPGVFQPSFGSGPAKAFVAKITDLPQFTFTGLFDPVHSPPVVNTANAGQVIPVRWQLTLNGTPVSDPSSFVSLSTYTVSCGTLTGNPSSTVQEHTAGSSGLQSLGGGQWQFTWKVPKSYANTCRIMVLTLSDGSTHIADFQFK